MVLQILFAKFWRKLSTIGVDDTESVYGRTLILLNQAAFMTSFGALIMYFLTPNAFSNSYHKVIALSLSVLYLGIPVLHYFRKPTWAQIYLIFILNNWIYVIILIFGGFFGQGIASMTTILLGYFFFQSNKKLRLLAVLYNCILFSFSSIYISIYSPVFDFPEVPFDEVLVYLISLSWIFVVFPIYEMERENLINSLKLKNEALENTTEELERFTHIASHDLKSPLRTIISFIGLVEMDYKKGRIENVEKNLKYVKSGAQQLNRLIEDVLELSKINATKNAETTWVNLEKVLEMVTFNLSSELQEKNATIKASELPNCFCNQTEFILVFQNLIQNGIKYNKSKNPTIRIWSKEEGDYFLIHFQDNGIGIEEQYFNRVFEHFKRLHTSDEYSGTGLGLSLCKKIIEKYQGHIKVESKLGIGCIFSLCLPIEMIEIQVQSNGVYEIA